MKYYEWSREKNEKLKNERGVGFEEVVTKIISGDVLDVISNPSHNYPNQKVYVIKMKNYVHYIPYVEEDDKVFLKTIIPSRKATKEYLKSKLKI